jgi:hypothetical protein
VDVRLLVSDQGGDNHLSSTKMLMRIR